MLKLNTIGPHGTAKSALLNRIAEALRIEHRHYNTNLISFDDLVGYRHTSRNNCFASSAASQWEFELSFPKIHPALVMM